MSHPYGNALPGTTAWNLLLDDLELLTGGLVDPLAGVFMGALVG